MNNYLRWGSGDVMKPTTADIIDSIIWSLDTYVAPEVQAPFASSVLLTVGNLLRHVKLRAQQEVGLLAEDNADLVAVLAGCVKSLAADPALGESLQSSLSVVSTTLEQQPGEASSSDSVEHLSDVSDVLRQVLDDLIRALGAVAPALQSHEHYVETRQRIRDYLARQLKREGSLITPAFTGGRR